MKLFLIMYRFNYCENIPHFVSSVESRDEREKKGMRKQTFCRIKN